jgi:hypothetical protein
VVSSSSSPPDPPRGRLATVTKRERALLLRAGVALPVTAAALRVLGYRRTTRLVARGIRASRQRRTAPDVEAAIESAVRMVDAASARLPFRPACLPRSVTLWWLLGRQGIDTKVVLGVRPADQGIAAHAWVEYDGRPLNDTAESVGEFAALRRGER